MHDNSTAGRLLAAMLAFLTISLAGYRSASAQSISYDGPKVVVYSVSQISSMPLTTPVRFGAASYLALGTAGLWNAGDDQDTSGPNPLGGIETASEHVPDYVSSDSNETQGVQTLTLGAIEVVSSDNVPFYHSGAADYVMLKNSGAVSGEWFQPLPSAASK